MLHASSNDFARTMWRVSALVVGVLVCSSAQAEPTPRGKKTKPPAAQPAPTKPSASAPAPAAPTGAPLELPSVLSKLAKIEALQAHFVEEKRMALLAQPMRSQGTLYYAKPRLLARHTEQPRKSSLLLRDETLSFGDAKHSESIALSAQPSLRVLVDTFVSVLGGDLAALERVAALSIEPLPNQGFRIRVTPKDDKVKRLVRAMSFEGQGALLSRMELLDANGDTTVTTFSDVTLRGAFNAAERTRIFRIGG